MKITIDHKLSQYKKEVEFRPAMHGEMYLFMGDGSAAQGPTLRSVHVLAREGKLLDWSLVSLDVLVLEEGCPQVRLGDLPLYEPYRVLPCKIDDKDQGFNGSVCPVDPEACIVDVKTRTSTQYGIVAKNIYWRDVIQFRVSGLADGYSYPQVGS